MNRIDSNETWSIKARFQFVNQKYRIIKIQMRSYSEILQVIIMRALRTIGQTIQLSPVYWSLPSLKGSYLSMFIFFVCSCWMLWQWDRYHNFFEEKNQIDRGYSRPAFIECRLSLLFEVSQKYTMWFAKFNSQIFQKIQVYLSLGSKRQEKTTGVLEIFAVNLQVTSR